MKNEESLRRLREEKIERETVSAERTKWEKELSRQLSILRVELSKQLNNERQEAIKIVSRQKDEELQANKKGNDKKLLALRKFRPFSGHGMNF